MLTSRKRRAIGWGLIATAVLIYVGFGQKTHYARGEFSLRPIVRAEVHAPQSGVLHLVNADEGERVSPGQVVARLTVTNLDVRQSQAQTEVRELEARLKLLLAGTREEEIAEQRERRNRAKHWLDLAVGNLEKAKQAFEEEIIQLASREDELKAELECAELASSRMTSLLIRGDFVRICKSTRLRSSATRSH